MDVLKQARALDVNLDALMNIIVRSTEVRNSVALLDLISSDMADVLHHDGMVCGYGITGPNGCYVHNSLHYNYPRGYGEALTSNDGRGDSPLIRRWRTTQEPIAFQTIRDDADYPEEWVNTFKKHGLRNTVAHGVLDVRSTFGSYFIFSNISGEVGEKEQFLLKLLMPHLHFALMRALNPVPENGKPAITSQELVTDRQKEILLWMNQGKTNWEIAQILSTTENIVKYNIEQILSRLEVRNRTQAVAKATLMGLLN